MSFHRENVTWQDPNGNWCMGFFTVIEPAFEDRGEDWDDEYDVDYDHRTFEFATVGHATEQAAFEAGTADRANPGGSMVYRLADQPEQCAEFDAMAAAWLNTATDGEAGSVPEFTPVPPTVFTVTARRGDNGEIVGGIAPYAVDLAGLPHVGDAAWAADEQTVYIQVPAQTAQDAHTAAYANPAFTDTIAARLAG